MGKGKCMGIDDKKRAKAELLERMMEANECLKEEIRHVKKLEAMRKTAKRGFLVLFALLTVVVHYLSFTSPGWVVVNRNGEIRGLTNKARATLQGNRFWRDQLHEVNREIQGDESGILRNGANERTLDKPVRDTNREMERFFGRYPQFRSSKAELHAEAVRGQVNQIKWITFNSFLEETRRKRFQELQIILPVVQSKAG